MKIGIMGGTFNPIHKGHILLAECAMEQYSFDRIWFMPLGHPAHKSDKELISAKHRIAMVELAIQGRQNYILSTIETERTGNTYTSDTLLELNKKYPEDEFYFLIGGDSLMKFHNWVRPDIISKYAVLVAAGRNGYSKEELMQQAERLKDSFGTKTLFLDMPELPISSNEIRMAIRMGKQETIQSYIPEQVWNYIIQHQVYQ